MQAQGIALPDGQGTATRGRKRRSQVAYTVAEFAALLGKHPHTVYEWIRKGQVPCQRIGSTYFIPEHALGRLRPPPPEDAEAADPPGGEAA
jgi:excisionase family DNA binding protein